MRLHVSHLHDTLSAEVARHKHGLIIALKFRRDARNRVSVGACIFTHDHALLQFNLTRQLKVVAALLHDDIEAGEVVIAEVHTRLGHQCVDHFLQELDVGACIARNSLNKAMITVGTNSSKNNPNVSQSKLILFGAHLPEVVFDIVQLDFYESKLTVCHLLL